MFRSTFEKALEKATNPLNVEPELTSLIQLCDYIRSGEVSPKVAIGAIRKRLEHQNQHIVQHSLVVLESCAKNCGSQFHEEIASRDFNEFIKDFVRRPKIGDQARIKMLELVQSWQQGFRQKPEFHIFTETYNELKSSGMQFPEARESDAMFDSQSAPAWKDAAQCYRCRTAFGTITRKHHCRNCGQVFCNDCTSRYCPIPKYGIEKDVRVCDKCYDELHNAAKRAARGSPERERSASQSGPSAPAKPAHKPTEAELKAEEEFETQLAIAMSLSAQEEAKKQQDRRIVAEYLSQTVDSPNESKVPSNGSAPPPQPASLDTRDMDAELAMYLNRNYWQQRSEQLGAPASAPSAPVATPRTSVAGSIDVPVSTSQQARPQADSSEEPANGTLDELSSPVAPKKCAEEEQFVDALRKTLLIFTNRVRSNRASVRNVGDDTSVQSLFTTLSRMLPELKALKDKYAARKAYYEALQDKLNEIRDGRQVLDAMRSEAAERRRRAEEEAARQRQLDMFAKLEQFRAYKQQMLTNTLRIMEEQQRMGSLYAPNAQPGNPAYLQSQFPYPNQTAANGQSVASYPPASSYPYAAQPVFNSQAPPEFPQAAPAPPYPSAWPPASSAPASASFANHPQALPPAYAHASLPTNELPTYQAQAASHNAYQQPSSQATYAPPSQQAYSSAPANQPQYSTAPPAYAYQQAGSVEPQSFGAPPQTATNAYGPPAAAFQQQPVTLPADVPKTEEQLISFD